MKNSRKIRAALVDDHLLFREGMKDLLMDAEDIEVVAEGGDGTKALSIAAKGKADVLITDLFMPHLGGISAIRRLREFHPELKIIVVSMYEDEEHRREALEAGAWAYHSKMDSAADIIKTIRRVMRQRVPDKNLPHMDFEKEENLVQLSFSHILTTTEQRVLEELGRGSSNLEISDRLAMCERTVKNHLSSIFRKMNVKTRLEAVRKGVEKKWIDISL